MSIDRTIEILPVEKLVPYIRNPRNNDGAVKRMVASIREFGFKIPLLVRSDGEIVDGHLRLKAALKLGMTEVPIIRCNEWSPAQVKAFRLMINRSATWAEWDEGLLALEFSELEDLNFDLALTGFDPREIDMLVAGSGAEDDAQLETELPAKATSLEGDTWLCGGHRVMCGDATSATSVTELLGSADPVLMVTDAPYGVSYDPTWRAQAGLGAIKQSGMVVNDDRTDWSQAYSLFRGDVAYVWHAGVHAVEAAVSLQKAGFDIRSQIIWAKQHFVISRGNYHWQHEPCWYAVRKGKSSRWRGDRTQSTLWEVPNLNPFAGGNRDEAATGHGTQKPIELVRRAILNHTERCEAVYDPFLGSGTTLVAAELTGRVAYGLDIDPRYVDLTIRRWEQLTSRQATLAGDGHTFDQVSVTRGARGEAPKVTSADASAEEPSLGAA